jgi:uncharacterized membrane protein
MPNLVCEDCGGCDDCCECPPEDETEEEAEERKKEERESSQIGYNIAIIFMIFMIIVGVAIGLSGQIKTVSYTNSANNQEQQLSASVPITYIIGTWTAMLPTYSVKEVVTFTDDGVAYFDNPVDGKRSFTYEQIDSKTLKLTNINKGDVQNMTFGGFTNSRALVLPSYSGSTVWQPV